MSLKRARKKIGLRAIGKRRLSELMSPFGSDFSYGQGSGSIGAVASYYVNGKTYPDKTVVRRALAQVEDDLSKMDSAAFREVTGWGPREARELRNIAGGLKYALKHDY